MGAGETFWYETVYDPVTEDGDDQVVAGIGAMLTAAIISTTPVILILRRWRPPAGAFTILWTFLGFFISVVFDQDDQAIIAGLAGGVVADIAIRLLDAGPDRPLATRAVATIAPLTMAAAFFIAVGRDLQWQSELWGGAIFFSGLAGLALDLLTGARQSGTVEQAVS